MINEDTVIIPCKLTVSSRIMGKCDGQFFPSKKFNKKKQNPGHVEYFKKSELPKPPPDAGRVFG